MATTTILSLDPNAWAALSALGTCIAALFAAVAAYYSAKQVKIGARAIQIETILRQEEIFASDEIVAKRVKIATQHKKDSTLNIDVEDILDFFDSLGWMVRRNVLSSDVVWHYFFHWIRGYHTLAESYVAEHQKTEPAKWKDFGFLFDEVSMIEKKEGGAYRALSDAEFKEFLLEEKKLEE